MSGAGCHLNLKLLLNKRNKKTRDMSVKVVCGSCGGVLVAAGEESCGVLSSGNLIPCRQSCTKSPPGTPARFSQKLWKYSLAVSYFMVWSKPKQIP